MVDEVEIKNVGGRGVASEATLQVLIDAVRGRSGDQQSAARAEQRMRDLNNRALRENTGEQKSFSGTVKKTAGNLTDLSKELMLYNRRLGDFAGKLFGETSFITGLVRHGDRLVDQFRDLSSAGASFNNSIGDMITSSVNASMNLNDFLTMVQNNTQELARFGGTATLGAKMIGEFSRDVRLGIGQRFFEMGMTIESMNESMISYMTLETMRGRRSIRNDAETRASAANYIGELDQLAKLTGQQKDSLMSTQAALQTDAQVRNQLSRVERDRGAASMEQLRSIYTLQQTALPGFHDSLMDLSDGVAQSDMARVLQQNVKGLDSFMLRVSRGEVGMEEYTSYMATNVAPVMQKYTEGLDDATLQVMRGAGGFYSAMAEAADGSHEFTNFINMNSAAAKAEASRRGAITSYLGRFEQSLQSLRSFIMETFINSEFGKMLSGIMDDVAEDLTGTGTGAIPKMKDYITRSMGFLFGNDDRSGIVTKAFRWIADFIQSDEFQKAWTKLGEGVTAVGNYFGAMYEEWNSGKSLWEILVGEIGSFGSLISTSIKDLMGDEQLKADIVEAFTKVYDAISETLTEFWEGSRGQTLANKIGDYFEQIMLDIRNQLNSSWVTGLLVDNGNLREDNAASEQSAYSSGSMSIEEARAYEDRMRQRLERFEAAAAGDIGARVSTRMNGPQAEQAAQAVRDILNSNSYARGTSGFQNFGSGTPAMLHNTEAVVPRNTPAGEALSDFYKNQSSNSFSSGGGDQSEVVNKLSELNTNIVRLLRTTEQGVGYQERTAKGVRGMGTDIFKGAGAR
jgi:hypothetical protein